MIGAYIAPIVKEKPAIPTVTPMRRGRPSKSESGNEASKPNPSPMRGFQSDPFMALDSNASSAPSVSIVDDVSARYPPIDEFSILSDSTTKFAFDPKSGTKPTAPKDINQRVTDALADDAFARPSRSYEAAPTMPKSIQSSLASKTASKDGAETSRPITAQLPTDTIDMSQRPTMVSIGTMTSPSTPPMDNPKTGLLHPAFTLPSSDYEITKQPQVIETPRSAPSTLRPSQMDTTRPRFLDHRSKSHTSSLNVSRAPGSSRPSLEGQRPSKLDLEGTINRSKSASSRSRPSSVYIQPKKAVPSGQEHASEDAKKVGSQSQAYDAAYLRTNLTEEPEGSMEASNISSNVEFLRAMEEEDPSRRKEKRLSSGSKHIKRASMPSISLSSTKSLLAGRFGDAFRRFETNMGGNSQRASSPSSDQREKMLTPITGSEATDGRSDDGHSFEETEPIPPEVRRELERRRLSQEEKRVANATAAHRQKISQMVGYNHERSGGETQPHSRAASIQSKVKTLLDQNDVQSAVKPEAGFRRYSPQAPRQNPNSHLPEDSSLRVAVPHTPKKTAPYNHPYDPVTTNSSSVKAIPTKLKHVPLSNLPNPLSPPVSSSTISVERPSSRPSAPPKPPALRTGNREPELVIPAASSGLPVSRRRPEEGVVSLPTGDDDWEEKFSKKYPSLAGLEMVERDIDLAR